MKKLASKMKDLPDIGAVVRKLLKEQHTTQRKLAKMLGWNSGTVSLLLKRKNWQVTELLPVGNALKHDLLQYYYPVPPEPQVPVSKLNAAEETIAALQKQLSEQETELLKLRTENALMREVLGKKG